MRNNNFVSFLRREPVLLVALTLAICSSFFVPFSFSSLVMMIDWKVLGCLASLMLVVAGFRKQRVFSRLADALLRRVHGILGTGFALVFITFFFSMLITNDVALITFVPFTIAVYLSCGKPRAVLPVVVLQTVAANIGSALTPVGNPQNLYLYSRYGFSIGTFFSTMLPFTVLGAMLLMLCLWLMLGRQSVSLPRGGLSTVSGCNGLGPTDGPVPEPAPEPQLTRPSEVYPPVSAPALIRYALLFVISLCAVFSVIPWYVAVCIVVCAMLPDYELFGTIDWSLLLTFVGFFVFIGNLSVMDGVARWFVRLLDGHVFSTSLLASQLLSNVPATLLLSQFTEEGVQLLLGVNAGGCGTLIASLASVISYKYYARFCTEHSGMVPGVGRYIMVFTVVNLLFVVALWFCHMVIW